MKRAKIGLPKGSGKRLKVREKSVKSQGILKWILSDNPDKVIGFGTSTGPHLQEHHKVYQTAFNVVL